MGKEDYQGQITPTINNGNILPTLDEKIKYSNNQDFQNLNLNYNEQTLNLVNDNLFQETNINSFNDIDNNQNIYPDTQTAEPQVFPTSFIQPEANQEYSNFLENTDLEQYIQSSTAIPQFNDSTPIEQNLNIQEYGTDYSDIQTTIQQKYEYIKPSNIYNKVSNYVTNKVNDVKYSIGNVKGKVQNVKEKVQNAIPNPINHIKNISSNYLSNTIETSDILNPVSNDFVTPTLEEGINKTIERSFCNNHIPTIIKIEDEEKIPICPDFVCKIYKSIFG